MHPEVIVDPCLEIKIAVKKMRRIMGWKKTIDVGIDIDKIETPWLNQTYWDSLPAKSRWELRKDQFHPYFTPFHSSL